MIGVELNPNGQEGSRGVIQSTPFCLYFTQLQLEKKNHVLKIFVHPLCLLYKINNQAWMLKVCNAFLQVAKLLKTKNNDNNYHDNIYTQM